MPLRVRIESAVAERWSDLERLFGARGACGGCWCMWYRLQRAEYERKKGAGNRAALRRLLGTGEPAGVIAYAAPLRQAPIGGREYLIHRLALRAAATGADLVEQEESAAWFFYAALAYAIARRDAGAVRSPKPAGAAWTRALEYTARVHEVIGRGFQDQLTLARIGRAVHCSPFHLSRLVTAVTGAPIHRLLVRHRLRHALERVLDSRDSLSAIAFSTGFSSHSHLTDAFHREFGCSPAMIRRRAPAELRSLLGPRRGTACSSTSPETR